MNILIHPLGMECCVLSHVWIPLMNILSGNGMMCTVTCLDSHEYPCIPGKEPTVNCPALTRRLLEFIDSSLSCMHIVQSFK